jgi:hypothetical protein
MQLGQPTLAMRDISRVIPLLVGHNNLQGPGGIKIPLGQEPNQQQVHLRYGQGRRSRTKKKWANRQRVIW